MSVQKKHLVTAALPYANGPVHIGHLAGCYLPADLYVRYLKACGKEVLFICGSDEHGVPITIKAKKEGISPQQVVDKYHELMKKSFADFGIDFSYYGRTSSKIHHETAQKFFKKLYEKGAFKEEVTQQYYDEEAKQFLADRYITGTCPRCQNTEAYGDQCEKCGATLSSTDLINPKSTLSGAVPILKETKNWFLELDKLQPKIQKYIENQKKNWKTNVYGQCSSWLNEGLKPRAMTRDLDWGVKLPNEIKNAEGKVLYVWFDAPIGYISASKELLQNNAQFEDWWQNENTELVHFIGKDNIVFHCIIFPAMLMEHGNYILPTNVPANEFLNLEGEKISTSRNWAVWLDEYLKDLPERQDELRFVLTSIAPETKDSDFSWKDYQTRVNSELVSIFGNFINRVMVLSHKFYSGIVPELPVVSNEEILSKTTLANQEISKCIEQIKANLDNYKFRDALAQFVNIARTGNKYLAETEPWKLIKTDEQSTQYVMHRALQMCAALQAYSKIFIPHTAVKLAEQLNFDFNLKTISDVFEIEFKNGHILGKSEVLFKPVEDEEMEKQIEKLQQSKTENGQSANESEKNVLSEAQVKQSIAFEDFDKIDLRIGKVLEAEKVPKADKLLKLIVDLGFEKRTILSGIAEFYKPEDLIGKLVTVVVNLAPRKIRGIESQGMLLMAGNDLGKLFCVGPEQEIEPGSTVK